MEKGKLLRIYDLLRCINSTIKKNISCRRGFLGSRKINPSCMAVLMNLMLDGRPKTLKELSNDVGLANSTVSDIVDKLLCDGFVERIQDKDDRRRVLISLSENTIKKRHEIEGRCQERLETAMEHGSEDEINIVLKGLETFLEILKRGDTK